VEAGSNTSTVTLRVVGGDGKGSLKSETVKYGREHQRTRTRERLHWQEPTAYTKDRPVLSSERAPRKKQDRNNSNNSNKYLVRHQDLLTDRQSQCDFDLSQINFRWIILKWALEKLCVRVWIGSICLRVLTSGCSYEHGNEHSGFIKRCDFLVRQFPTMWVVKTTLLQIRGR
jgi:hypothetical protein